MARKASLGVIFLTVFVDLIGFGIVIPLLPVLADHFSGSKLLAGIVMASFSAMQFVFSPILGRLSDRIGRRPVLLASTATAALSYAIFAYACHMAELGADHHKLAMILILVSRLVAGACGANISVAQAYIADITPPEARSKSMGLIGMAFGLGFTIGPALGIAAMRLFDSTTGLGITASAICAINFVLALAILKESWSPSASQVQARPHWEQWKHTLSHPVIGLITLIYFLTLSCFACFETSLGLLVGATFDLDPTHEADSGKILGLFVFCGILGAAAQGGMTGRLVKTLGEGRLIALSLFMVAVSLVWLPFCNTATPLLIAIGLLAIGSSMTRPPLFGMVSKLTAAHEQGATIGVVQCAGSLGRIIGPVLAGAMMAHRISTPYLVYGTILGLTALLALLKLPRR